MNRRPIVNNKSVRIVVANVQNGEEAGERDNAANYALDLIAFCAKNALFKRPKMAAVWEAENRIKLENCFGLRNSRFTLTNFIPAKKAAKRQLAKVASEKAAAFIVVLFDPRMARVFFEVRRELMMAAMRSLPAKIWREERAEADVAEEIVDVVIARKRRVCAIVRNDKNGSIK